MLGTFQRMFSKDAREVSKLTNEDVILEALCAYRDKLILMGAHETTVGAARLDVLREEIQYVTFRVQNMNS